MMISTRGRYALRILVDLAENQNEGYITLKEAADRQEISEKYLESIVKDLVKARFVEGVRGKGGGYRLARPADEINVLEVLQSADGTLVPVACLEEGSAPCSRAAVCKTLPLWKGLERVVSEYLSGYTIRDLAEKLGVTLVETEYSGDRSPCCGYGGLTAYANPEVAGEITRKALERTDAPYITYCMACRDRFARQGRESRHILELIYGTDAGAPPDISEKRYNRLNLKRELLWELWQEETAEMKLDYGLTFTEEARRLMDGRMILTDDVIAVLNDYRESGEAILDSETGLLIARRRLGNATFWVKFTEDGQQGYIVHGAYSHRMNVVRREG